MTALGPGFHPSVPAADYHSDPCVTPSLSSSIARVLVSETPRKAWLAHPRLNQNFVKDDDAKFDFGSAVHNFLASGGRGVRIIPGFEDYKKAGARTERDKLRAQGFVPLLEHHGAQVETIASNVFASLNERDIELGEQECVMLAEDRGVMVRAMFDSWSPPDIRDFKVTAINLANDHVIGHHIADLDYDLRAYFYVRVASLTFPKLAGRIKFSWIFVEKDEPHGIRIIDADATILEMGRRKYEHALGVWQKCMKSGLWPHLDGLPATVPYPGYAEAQWLDREIKDGFVMGPIEMLKRGDDADGC
jgi:hypothetical protein